MAKKKKNIKTSKNEFNSDPFKHLKGFAFSSAEKDEDTSPVVKIKPEAPKSFSAEMEMLGVQRLNQGEDLEEEFGNSFLIGEEATSESADQSDEELFLSALGELTVSFQDQLPDETITPQAEPRRMKQLKQGRVTPDAFLDLHGCKRVEVAAKISHFLNNSFHHGHLTVVIITGKGLHSEGGVAVLRDEAEQFLTTECAALVSEWGRAPKQYGGNGALVVFLRKK